MENRIGIGIQDFSKLREKNRFYIDKTSFIKEWWESGEEVTLITRPRRFGKTLNMSMVEQFFSINYANRGDLFEGLFVWQEEEYRSLQGTYPVISLTFANVKEDNYNLTRKKICQLIVDLYVKYSYVKESNTLTNTDRNFFNRILDEFSPEIQLSKFAELMETIISWSLKTLSAGIIGLNIIQGLLTPAIDSVKRSLVLKGGEALPIVGDAIGGAAEVVLGTAVLIKNGIGVAGMIICLVMCLVPIIQIAITSLMYQLIAALIQPVSDKRMVNCVSSVADGSKILLKIVFTTGVLFLITIAVVATTTGG